MSLYLKIDDIEGNVTASGLEGTIALTSYQFNVQRKFNTQAGVVADREAGSRPALSEISVTKIVDETTPKFFTQATVGKSKSKAVLSFVNTGSELSEYMTITLKNVLVSSQKIEDKQTIATNGDDSTTSTEKPVETLTLNFEEMEVKYTPYDAEHNAGSPISAGYNVRAATAA